MFSGNKQYNNECALNAKATVCKTDDCELVRTWTNLLFLHTVTKLDLDLLKHAWAGKGRKKQKTADHKWIMCKSCVKCADMLEQA